MKSVLQKEKECFLCRHLMNADTVRGLEEHHVFFGTANRALSEKHGMKVWLCKCHHTSGIYAVHRYRENDLLVKRYAQRVFENTHSRDEFINTFGRSYI